VSGLENAPTSRLEYGFASRSRSGHCVGAPPAFRRKSWPIECSQAAFYRTPPPRGLPNRNRLSTRYSCCPAQIRARPRGGFWCSNPGRFQAMNDRPLVTGVWVYPGASREAQRFGRTSCRQQTHRGPARGASVLAVPCGGGGGVELHSAAESRAFLERDPAQSFRQPLTPSPNERGRP